MRNCTTQDENVTQNTKPSRKMKTNTSAYHVEAVSTPWFMLFIFENVHQALATTGVSTDGIHG